MYVWRGKAFKNFLLLRLHKFFNLIKKEERAAENGNSTHEIGDSYMINSNFVINNNVYYENPYVIHNYNGNYMGYPGVENRNPYLRKTSCKYSFYNNKIRLK